MNNGRPFMKDKRIDFKMIKIREKNVNKLISQEFQRPKTATKI